MLMKMKHNSESHSRLKLGFLMQRHMSLIQFDLPIIETTFCLRSFNVQILMNELSSTYCYLSLCLCSLNVKIKCS